MCRTGTGSSIFMQANHSSLGNQAFGDHADTLTIIRYGSHHDAYITGQTIRVNGGMSMN